MVENKLELCWITHEGGANQTPTKSIDFLIDGESLFSRIAHGRDLAGVFSPRWENNAETAKQFKKETVSTLIDGRVLIFACGECGDIACGGITMDISQNENHFIWSDFAYENNYDNSMTDRESYRSIGPFQFKSEEYLQAINVAAKLQAE